MGISEDIQQSKFISAHQKAIINILYTSSWIAEKTRSILLPQGITEQQFNVLRILRGNFPDPLSTLQIRERMLDKMSDTSRLVDRMTKKDLIVKKTNDHDKRLVDIVISEKGLELLKIADANEDHYYAAFQGIDKVEAEKLSELLDKLRAAH